MIPALFITCSTAPCILFSRSALSKLSGIQTSQANINPKSQFQPHCLIRKQASKFQASRGCLQKLYNCENKKHKLKICRLAKAETTGKQWNSSHLQNPQKDQLLALQTYPPPHPPPTTDLCPPPQHLCVYPTQHLCVPHPTPDLCPTQLLTCTSHPTPDLYLPPKS